MRGSPLKGSALSPAEVDASDAPVSLNQPAKAGTDMRSNSQLVMRSSLAAGMKAIELNAIKQQKDLAQEAEAQEETQ